MHRLLTVFSPSSVVTTTPYEKYPKIRYFFFQIDANDVDCYYDRVKSGTKMGLIFEVAEGGALDIDVSIEGK